MPSSCPHIVPVLRYSFLVDDPCTAARRASLALRMLGGIFGQPGEDEVARERYFGSLNSYSWMNPPVVLTFQHDTIFCTCSPTCMKTAWPSC